MRNQEIQKLSNYTTKPYQKLSDIRTQELVAECIADFLAYLLIKRDIQLNHRVNRDPTRSSNKNRLFSHVSIIDMMRMFNNKHSLFNDFEVPKLLLPFSSFYTSSCSTRIKRGTLYRVLQEILNPEFQTKYPMISFISIAYYYKSKCGKTLSSLGGVRKTLQDYQSFLLNRRKHLK